QQRHELHFTDRTLHHDFEDGDLGPTTEVQEEVALRTVYDPTHPHADANGYVQYPDINVVEEMTQMMSANRIYEANLTVVQAAKEMIKRTLEI
ncbi:MAG TPA: flagellar basal body rod C-terminal domain-containing protein, partial [Rhodothermales bacterium]